MTKSYKPGIHHITVLAGDPKANAGFYVKKLGMRLVKKSVNQDDPGTYHLFYANEAAQPGSSLTFFPWPRAHKGETGTGEAVNVAFRVPADSLEFWLNRLEEEKIEHSGEFELFGHPALRFQDPDGLELDLVFEGTAKEKVSSYESTVDSDAAVQGFFGTRLKVVEPEATAAIIRELFGFTEKSSGNGLALYQTDADIGNHLYIEQSPEQSGKGGRGIVHHVAFRARDEDHLSELREKVIQQGLNPTKIIDRHWFKSVYFREPNGVLFEMATDGPGYAVDEDFEELGKKLILTPWLEPYRERIEQTLPNLELDL